MSCNTLRDRIRNKFIYEKLGVTLIMTNWERTVGMVRKSDRIVVHCARKSRVVLNENG